MSVQCILSGKVDTPSGTKVINGMLNKDQWIKTTENGQDYHYQDVAFPGYKEDDDGIIGISQAASLAERQAAAEGVFTAIIGASGDGVIRVACDGKKPDGVDIPVTLIILN